MSWGEEESTRQGRPLAAPLPDPAAATQGKSLGAGGRGEHLEQKPKKYLATALFALVLSHPALACETASLDIVFVTNNSSKTFPAVLPVAQTSCSDFGSHGVRRCQLLRTSVTSSAVRCRTGISLNLNSQALPEPHPAQQESASFPLKTPSAKYFGNKPLLPAAQLFADGSLGATRWELACRRGLFPTAEVH